MAKKTKKEKVKKGKEVKQASNVIKTEEEFTEPIKPTVKFFTKQEVDEDEGTVTAVISTDAIDRDREVLSPKGADIENFLKNPVVLWVHNSFGMPVGKAIWIKKGRKKITAKVKFVRTDLGQEVFEMFKGGFLNAFSVGFIVKKAHTPTPDEIKKRPALAEAFRIFDEWELLEFSVVPVPANQEALATAVKEKTLKIRDETLEDMDVDIEETFLTEDEQKKADEEKEVEVEGEKDKIDPDSEVTAELEEDEEELVEKTEEEETDEIESEEVSDEIEVNPIDVDVKAVTIDVSPVEIEVTPIEEPIKVKPVIDIKEVMNEEIKRIKGIVYR